MTSTNILQKCRDRRLQALSNLERTRSNLFTAGLGEDRSGIRRNSRPVFIRNSSITS